MGYKFIDRLELETAVSLWISDKAQAITTYGNISSWDVINVSNFSSLFLNKTTFDEDLSSWNMSNATNFQYMFYNAKAFDNAGSNAFGGIASWDTSNVTNMRQMFDGATSFNRNVTGWDTSEVITMFKMFFKASSFNNGGVALKLDFSKVTTFAMFMRDAKVFNQDIENIGSTMVATTINSAWMGADVFNGKIINFDTSNVTDFRGTFIHAKAFNQDISYWNVSNGTTFQSMFQNNLVFNQNIRNWQVSPTATLTNMFFYSLQMHSTYGSLGSTIFGNHGLYDFFNQVVYQDVSGVKFDTSFGGAILASNPPYTYTVPASANKFAGFSTLKDASGGSPLSLNFQNGATISFTGSTINNTKVAVRFKFQNGTGTNNTISFKTSKIAIIGTTPTTYLLNIPPQTNDTTTYKRFMLNILDRDEGVTLSNVFVEETVPVVSLRKIFILATKLKKTRIPESSSMEDIYDLLTKIIEENNTHNFLSKTKPRPFISNNKTTDAIELAHIFKLAKKIRLSQNIETSVYTPPTITELHVYNLLNLIIKDKDIYNFQL